MSDWPTALVTGLCTGVTAITAALLGARFRLRREREQEWRRWQVEAAAVLSTKVGGASDAIGHAIKVLEQNKPDPKAVAEAVSDADWLAGEASLPLAHFLLFADERSETLATAKGSVEALREAANALLEVKDEEPDREDDRREILERARAGLARARDLQKRLVKSVRSATRPSALA